MPNSTSTKSQKKKEKKKKKQSLSKIQSKIKFVLHPSVFLLNAAAGCS
jgi:hypothetical protein